ncbi:ephrin type-A receptor 3-like [Patiria miniata]|uniref:receptor protein-tyrosine kinase n=1 Tax=Patiria miniata TaxID=46514 RepID=A0A914B8Z8_PATMI|nr:ephrin type-A receptor 3-like [Patiria miniata]
MPNLAWTFRRCVLNSDDPFNRPVWWHPSCCDEQTVKRSSITPTFIVRTVGPDQWELDVNVSWARPDRLMNFDAYAVQLDYTKTAYVAYSCVEYQNSDFSFTELEWILFGNVPFGSTPYFIIYTANRTAELINRGSTDRELHLADCYESTENVSFCRTQDVEVAGRPIGLKVDSLIGTWRLGGVTLTASVTVSWNPPAQINGEMTGFEVVWSVNGSRLVPSTTIDVPMNLSEYSDPLSLSFNHSFIVDDVENESNLKIEVAAKVNQSDEVLVGNAAVLSITVGPDNFTVPTAGPPTNIVLYVVVGAAALSSCIVVLAITCCICRRKRRPRQDDKPIIQFKRRHMESNYVVEPRVQSKVDECFAEAECDRNVLTEISTIALIGKGSFGVVYKGFAYGTVNGKPDYYPVAIKGLKENAAADMKQSFLEEIRLMIDIGRHPNILSVLGCCTIDEPYLLITEFMKYGDLLHFLWKTREIKMAEVDPMYCLTELNQLQIARQVTCGMEYLSQTRYYHGDLAARNVLVGDNLIVKVSDFGLSDDTYEMGYKRMDESKKRAVKWVSLETNTTNRCSIKSDVWSFGVVLYEIFTRGDAPYQGLSNQEVVEKLKSGYRMGQPDDCPSDVYAMMRECWHENPSKRPSFTHLYKSLDKMMLRHSDYLSFEESASSLNEPQDKVINTDRTQKHAKDTQHGNFESSEFSGKSDELELWLHLKGPLPDGDRTIEFVPQAGEDSIQSDTPTKGKADVKFRSFKRDRDCDVLTA